MRFISKYLIFFLFNLKLLIYKINTALLFEISDVKYKKFTSLGCPLLDINVNSNCIFGAGLVIVNSAKYSTLGKNNRCKFVVYKEASLIIGDNVGMSNTTIVATKSIIVGNNVMIGGGVTIIDSDFHSLNAAHWHTELDEKNMKSLPVIIKNNVFIGMDSIILKGVTVGSNSIVAAGSVVFKDIPDFQIWGGNPAVFIKVNNQKQ
ncbi:acyltransferase [Flavobacterium sp. ACAM 123]|jgi:acetyltransferase-like isoleucine patch superfamily enzyme|uniref:acyltransferase n=1 Tax=Flavobacterium sp. ACAM 123 TaxID=1189620 RepID=UPI000378A15A|nr:acyltransferase [Flavobacterium sp. ACAM 123]